MATASSRAVDAAQSIDVDRAVAPSGKKDIILLVLLERRQFWMSRYSRCWQALLLVLAFCSWGTSAQPEQPKPPMLKLQVENSSVCPSFLALMQQRWQEQPQWWPEPVIPASFSGETLLAADPKQAAPLIYLQPELSHPTWRWLTWQPVNTVSQYFGWDGVASSVFARADMPTVALVDAASPTAQAAAQPQLFVFIHGQQLSYFLLPAQQALPKATTAAELALALKGYQLPAEPNAMHGLFQFEGGLYQLVKPWGVKQLQPKAQVSCQLMPQPQATFLASKPWQQVLRQSFVRAAEDSLAIETANLQLQDWLQRPWLIPSLQAQCDAGSLNCVVTTHRQAWLDFYASQDAWSARERVVIDELWQLAHLEMSHYFEQQFQLPAAAAKELATRVQAAYFSLLTADLAMPSPQQHLGFHAELPSYPLDLWSSLSADQQQQLVRQKNAFGKTALMVAAHFNDYDSVKHLLAAGADLHAQTNTTESYPLQLSKRDALSYAAENGHPAVISLLLSAGANASVRDSQNQAVSAYFSKNPSLRWRQLADRSLLDLMQQGRVPKPSAECQTSRQKLMVLLCSSQGLRLYADELQLRLSKLNQSTMVTLLSQDQRRWQQQLFQQCPQNQGATLLACVKAQYRARVRMLDAVIISIDAQ